MVASRRKPVELAVQDVGERREGGLIVAIAVGKGPSDPLKCQAACDPGILINVDVVIEIHELVTYRLSENHPRCRHK